MTPERRAAETRRKSAERQRRREAGEVRVEVWLDGEDQRNLRYVQDQIAGSASYAIHCALWSLANQYREDNRK